MEHQEREIEHFGFSSELASLERNYYVKKNINTALDGVIKKAECSEETNQYLLKIKDEVLKKIWLSIEGHMKAAEEMDKKYFSVPDHVLLPAYFDHVKTYSQADEKNIDDEIASHKKRFLENSIMITLLKMENSQHKKFIPFLDEELNIQNALKESFKNLNMNALNDLVDKTLAFGQMRK
uniref:Uncharacterized protein n=2 Tax=Stomoxys calcitrans TaxID=35570 RepID=A0A1I8NTX5_STOCA